MNLISFSLIWFKFVLTRITHLNGLYRVNPYNKKIDRN